MFNMLIFVSSFKIHNINNSDYSNRYKTLNKWKTLKNLENVGIFSKNRDWKSKQIKSNLIAIKCISNKFTRNYGTYVEVSGSNILIYRTEMIYNVEDFDNKTKFINTHRSSLEILNSSFQSDVRFSNELKICSIDPISPISIQNTFFQCLTYKFDSSSGISFYNNREFFSVIFINCNITVNNEVNYSKGERGGFYYQNEGNSSLSMISCYFSGCSAKEKGGCIYLNSYGNITNCTFNDCHSKEGSILYFSHLSNEIDFSGCKIMNIKKGNSIISINTNDIIYLEIRNFIFINISKQEAKVIGIKFKSNLEGIKFNNCSIYHDTIDYTIIKCHKIKTSIVSCIFNIHSIDNNQILMIAQNSIIENTIYNGNVSFGTFTANPFIMKNCSFYNINITNELMTLSVETVSIDNCSFIDIESSSNLYRGLGFQTLYCVDISLKNCLFERVGTSIKSGGLIIFQNALQSFKCIDCRIIRCYALEKISCFLLNDIATSLQRNITFYFSNDLFKECYLLESGIAENRPVSCIQFSTVSPNSYLEINRCTFVNPGLYESKYNRQCALQIKCPNFSLISNNFINVSNSVSSVILEINSNFKYNETFELVNHTFINCSSYDLLMYFKNQKFFFFSNCYFKDIFNAIGTGMGIGIDKSDGLEITFSNCSFINCVNHKSVSIFVSLSSKEKFINRFIIKDCYIEGSKSFQYGAFTLISTNAIVNNTIFKSCSSESDAGCLLINQMISILILNCVFDNNSAKNTAGAIFLDELTLVYIFNNLTARNNKAGQAGAFIFFDKHFGKIDLGFYEGENNQSPLGEASFSGKNSPGNSIKITSVTNKFLGFNSFYNVSVSKGSGSIVVHDSESVYITDFDFESCNISSSIIKLAEIKAYNAVMSLKSSYIMNLDNMEIINSPNINLSSTSILINNSFFKYQKLKVSQTQLRIMKAFTIVVISNTTFITNKNEIGLGDHIYSTVKIKLIIDSSCCFNEDKIKSIRVPIGSELVALDSVFNCMINDNEFIETRTILKKAEFDMIGFVTIFVSVIVLVIFLLVYVLVTRRKLDELSDDFVLSDLDGITVNVNRTTLNSSNNVLQTALMSLDMTDVSDCEFLNQIFIE